MADHVLEDLNSITISNAQASPLLRLPAELRNKVYEYVFTAPEATYTFEHTTVRATQPRRRKGGVLRSMDMVPNQLALLASCRQVHSEAKTLPFELNNFAFLKLRVFQRTAIRLLPFQRQSLQRIAICIDILHGVSDEVAFIWDMQCYGYRNLVDLLPNVKIVHASTGFDDMVPREDQPRTHIASMYQLMALDNKRKWILNLLRNWLVDAEEESEIKIVEKLPWWWTEEYAWLWKGQ